MESLEQVDKQTTHENESCCFLFVAFVLLNKCYKCTCIHRCNVLASLLHHHVVTVSTNAIATRLPCRIQSAWSGILLGWCISFFVFLQMDIKPVNKQLSMCAFLYLKLEALLFKSVCFTQHK